MTALAWLFLALVLALTAALIWAVHTITKRTEEYRRELNAHETTRGALAASRQAHHATRTEMLGADVSERYWRVVADRNEAHITEMRDAHTLRMLELELAGRILPDLRDEHDLMVPSWPMVDAPIFDSTPDALEVDALVLAAVAERVAS